MLLSSLLKVVVASLCLGSIIAQKVTQDQPQVLGQEKETVTLDCKYDTSDSRYSLLWYKQPSSGGMILLIRQDSYKQQNATEGQTRGDSVTQLSGQVTLPEKAAVTINCTYLATGHPTLFCFSALDFPGPILFSSFSEEKPADRSLLLPQSSDMKRALFSVLVMVFTLGGTRAQTVTQPESHISVSEGDPVQVKCSYSYSGSPALFWKGTEAQGKARAVLALLGMWPTGFGSPVVNIPISAAPPDKPPVLTEKSREQGSFSFANMHPVTHSVLLIILVLGGTNGDSVNQTEGPVTVSERALMTLNCTYQTADFSSYLYWYVQHLNKAPQLLLKGLTADKKLLVAPEMLLPKHNYKNAEFNSYNGFNIPGGCSPQDYRQDLTRGMSEHPPEGSIMAQKVTQNRSEISVLEKEDVTLNCAYEANSYTYYLFWYKQPPSGEMIFLIHQESYNELNTTKGLSGEDQVEQSPQTLRIQEGVSISLNCSYTVSNFRALQWYRQDPGKGPELLFLLYSVGDEKQEERLRATLLKKGSSLRIEAPKPEDSATETWVQVSQSSGLFVGNLLEGSSLPLHCPTMTLVFTLMLEMLLFLTGAGAQSVTQPDDHITVSEGARLELKCNYSSSVSPYLFWYVQYPNQGLQLLLKYESGDSLVSGIKGFEAEFRRRSGVAQKVTQDQPYITSQIGQSVILNCRYEVSFPQFKPLILILSSCDFSGSAKLNDQGKRSTQSKGSGVAQNVTQNQTVIISQVGKIVTLNCQYEISRNVHDYWIFWYQQLPSGEMTYLIHQYSEDRNERDGRYSVNFQKARSSAAQKVTQDPPDISNRIGESVTLNCRYEISQSHYIFWYKHLPSGEMIFLTKDGRFSIHFDRVVDTRYFEKLELHLTIFPYKEVWKKLKGKGGNPFRSRQIQQLFLKRKKREMLLLAPVLILWIQISEMNGQQIKHFPEFLLLQEGENFTTYCNSSSLLSSLQWYKQRPGGSPVLLMILTKSGEVKTQQRWTGSGVAQKVTQDQSDVSSQVGQSVTLSCRYETSWSVYYLYWYKQLPSGQMTYVIRQSSEATNERKERYSVNFKKADKSIKLTISALQLEDSAKNETKWKIDSYIPHEHETVQRTSVTNFSGVDRSPKTCECFKIVTRFWIEKRSAKLNNQGKKSRQSKGSSVAQKVTQYQPDVTSQVPNIVILNCRYETSWNVYTYWIFRYKQLLSGEMTYLIHQYSEDGNERDGHYAVNFQKAPKFISLTVSSLKLEHSGKYFCALWERTVLEVIGKAEQKPQSLIRESLPAVGPRLKYKAADPRQEIVVLWFLNL
ncbi:hypothetical protein MJG53_008199 [Ovis ammon polii x Ovis aries]|uniref:Uncharacterized protein n=1 Tax=Ovis ammon polii x Ovis aries TaxID=2918886 RepID=A0ACB9UZS8_9CETA|nr:hypothetical protein MJG53_008199 [Ovis ammon polii x Ovis aries]